MLVWDEVDLVFVGCVVVMYIESFVIVGRVVFSVVKIEKILFCDVGVFVGKGVDVRFYGGNIDEVFGICVC